jgi:hypothetical protein
MRMSAHPRIPARLADQRGAVLITFAVFAPLAILLATFAIDASNWYLHKRHLQLQADAGALAAAREFQACSNTRVEEAAHRYSGVGAGEPYNPQLGGTPPSNVHELINSKTYYEQPKLVDPSAVEKPPCEASMVDLKLTETNLPWYWHPFSSVANINAHARVEVLQVTTAAHVEPLAVAETSPVAAAAYFVDEDKGDEVLTKATLQKQGTNPEGKDVWSSQPVEVTISRPHIGVIIALSGAKNDVKCGDTFVKCFDETATTGPSLLHIQGWSAANPETGSYKAPIARQVTLQPASCSDAYFAPAGKGCTIGVTARVDLGTTPNPAGVSVKAVVGGGAAAAMTYDSTAHTWATASPVALPKEGANQVDLVVTCDPKASGSVCSGEKATTTAELKNVQRAYAAGESSGSIASAWVSEPGAQEPVPGSLDADSYEMCATCTHKLAVTVDVSGSISNAAGYNDPPHPLRFEGEQGVRAACPPTEGQSGSKYEEHLATGCPGQYKINTSDPNCTVNQSPYECLRIGLTGKDTGPTRHGMEMRIEKTPPPGTKFYCENNWKDNNNGGVPILPTDDSRLVHVFVMPYGSVDSLGRSLLGNEEIQIQDFAAFYVTGFPGDGCKSDPNTGNAEIVGHFVKYINLLDTGGGEKCVANSLGECVAVLTK